MDISPSPCFPHTSALGFPKTLPVLDDTALCLKQMHGERSSGASLRSQALRIRYRRHDEDVLLRVGGPAGRGDKPLGSDTEYQDEIRSARGSHSGPRGWEQRYSGDGAESGELRSNPMNFTRIVCSFVNIVLCMHE